jgi:hypothetical protein
MTKSACSPIRVLFVLACLDEGYGPATVRHLTEHLGPQGYRLDAIVCVDDADSGGSGLVASGVDVDCVPCRRSFEETVDYLAHRLPAYDLVVSCQNVADIYPALERLHWRPPLIEYGELVSEALAGPKHFTSRYVTASSSAREAAASRMSGRRNHAIEISPAADDATARKWHILFQQVLAERERATLPAIFSSFVHGGFECSTQVRQDGRRLDLLASTSHDRNAAADYRQLRQHGIVTVRDGVRWHLIEPSAGRYDWSSFLSMVRASRATGTQIIWDLMHYGWPDGLDIWSPQFVRRFARYAAAAARLIQSETDEIPFYCPINEISYFAWAGGDAAYLNPFASGRSFELKAQLARAAIEAMQEILAVDPRARFVHCEPVIHIVTPRDGGRLDAEQARQAQFQAFDMIAGRLWPQLGGEPRLLDIVGVNYYRQNQWELGGTTIEKLDRRYRPFRSLLAEVSSRYGRPILVAETGTEGDDRREWFETIASEVMAARDAGVPVEGLCLYPIIDHVGWDDDRDCASGLLANRFDEGGRPVHRPLASAISRLQEAARRSASAREPDTPFLNSSGHSKT